MPLAKFIDKKSEPKRRHQVSLRTETYESLVYIASLEGLTLTDTVDALVKQHRRREKI